MTTIHEVTTTVQGIEKKSRMNYTSEPPAMEVVYRTTLENGTVLYLPDHTLDIGQTVTLTLTTEA